MARKARRARNPETGHGNVGGHGARSIRDRLPGVGDTYKARISATAAEAVAGAGEMGGWCWGLVMVRPLRWVCLLSTLPLAKGNGRRALRWELGSGRPICVTIQEDWVANSAVPCRFLDRRHGPAG
jgi:hypothetical protein